MTVEFSTTANEVEFTAVSDPSVVFRFVAAATIEGGVSDHGALTGLSDDDHTQYAKADGTRGSFASTAQGALAATAVQPDDLPMTYYAKSAAIIIEGLAGGSGQTTIIANPTVAAPTFRSGLKSGETLDEGDTVLVVYYLDGSFTPDLGGTLGLYDVGPAPTYTWTRRAEEDQPRAQSGTFGGDRVQIINGGVSEHSEFVFLGVDESPQHPWLPVNYATMLETAALAIGETVDLDDSPNFSDVFDSGSPALLRALVAADLDNSKVDAAGDATTLWLGTESEYSAIGSPDANTVYVVTEDP